MPITEFPVTFETRPEDLTAAAQRFGFNDNEFEELVWSYQAVRAWAPWFVSRYGRLQKIRHRSNPDDPPDLDFVFESEVFGVEHTSLVPEPLARARNIAAKTNPVGIRRIPPIVPRKWTKNELAKLAVGFGIEDVWENVSDSKAIALQILTALVERKLSDPASHLVIVSLQIPQGGIYYQDIAQELWTLANASGGDRFAKRTVILNEPTLPRPYFSTLVRRGDELKTHREGRTSSSNA